MSGPHLQTKSESSQGRGGDSTPPWPHVSLDEDDGAGNWFLLVVAFLAAVLIFGALAWIRAEPMVRPTKRADAFPVQTLLCQNAGQVQRTADGWIDVKVEICQELLSNLNTGVYWQGLQTGAIWTAVVLIVIYLLVAKPNT